MVTDWLEHPYVRLHAFGLADGSATLPARRFFADEAFGSPSAKAYDQDPRETPPGSRPSRMATRGGVRFSFYDVHQYARFGRLNSAFLARELNEGDHRNHDPMHQGHG